MKLLMMWIDVLTEKPISTSVKYYNYSVINFSIIGFNISAAFL